MVMSHAPFIGEGNGGVDNYTVLMLHFDGVNTGTSFPDSSWKNHSQVSSSASTTNPSSKFGTGMGTFPANAYVATDGSSDFAFGTGDFTIDFWMFPNAVTLSALIDFRTTGTSNQTTPVLYFNSGPLSFYVNSADRIVGATPSTGAWSHVALARSGTSTKLFLNGTQTGSTYTDSNNYVVGTTNKPMIGASDAGGTTALFYNGYLDELRISKGIARWTSNFTVPGGPYA